MDNTYPAENGQAAHWNGGAGRAWVTAQVLLDLMFKPFEERLVDRIDAVSARRVLDVGCGTGSTALAVARRLGAAGQCLGADVSAPMVAAARARAERENSAARFILADVQTHAFEPQSFERIISRFGVMFFDNPVQAFANLLRAASSDAELAFIAWRSAAENPFMTTAERAAAPLLPNLPVRRPGAAGQFAFADRQRVAAILEASGWTGINIQPIDVECVLPENQLIDYFTQLGPVGLCLQEVDSQTRKQVVETVRSAFDLYVHGMDVRYTAACWMISARAPSA